MPLESTNTIEGLNTSWPLGGDGVAEGDDHLRQEKDVLKTMFPGTSGNGFNIPIIATEPELNFSSGVTSAIQAQLDSITANITNLGLGVVPVGTIIQYNGLFSAIPANFQLCDGTNGTPDMADNFVYGTNTEAELDNVGGVADAVVVSHNHTASTNTTGNHSHTYTEPVQSFSASGSGVGSTTTGTTSTDGDHSHTVTVTDSGVTGVNANIPPYIKLAFIRRMS